MKRKIDKIKNKRLVMGGGINNLSPNEILVEQKGDTISLKERVNGEIKEVSGSGSSNEGGGSNIEYLDVREAGLMLRVNLIVLAESAKYKSGDMKIVGLNSEAIRQFGGIPDPEIGDYLAVSIDFSRKMKMFNGDLAFDGTVMEMLTILGLNQAEIDAIPRITKEQFYSFE